VHPVLEVKFTAILHDVREEVTVKGGIFS